MPARNAHTEYRKMLINKAIDGLEKKYGEGEALRPLNDSIFYPETVPTGSFSLDLSLGRGGLPRGRITEIFGEEGSGKTTLALHIAANIREQGGNTAFIDLEHSLDPSYAAALGADDLSVFRPCSGEETFEIAEILLRSGAVDCIIFDSVAAIITKEEREGPIGNSKGGLLAMLMSKGLRILTPLISRSGCLTVFTNQLRERHGTAVTPGGRALKYYSSVRIEMNSGEKIISSGTVTGIKTKCTVVKNNLAPPFRQCEFDLIFGKGIDRAGEILTLGEKLGIIETAGGRVFWGGLTAEKDDIRSDKEIMNEIERLIMSNGRDIV